MDISSLGRVNRWRGQTSTYKCLVSNRSVRIVCLKQLLTRRCQRPLKPLLIMSSRRGSSLITSLKTVLETLNHSPRKAIEPIVEKHFLPGLATTTSRYEIYLSYKRLSSPGVEASSKEPAAPQRPSSNPILRDCAGLNKKARPNKRR